MNRALLSLGIVVLAACGAGRSADRGVAVDTLPGGIVRTISSSPADSAQWSLVLDHTVQPAEGEPGELMEPRDIALTESGLLLVAESNPQQVKVYDSSGRYLRSIGRQGEGPGEFKAAYIAVHGDTLVVQDPRATRASSFLVSTGTFIGSRPTACCFYFPLAIDGTGRAVAYTALAPDSTADPSQGFVRFTMTGSSLDTVRIPERPKAVGWTVRQGDRVNFTRLVPLTPRDLHAIDRRGDFITGWNAEYALRTTRTGSDTIAIFGRIFTRDPVSPSEKQAIVDGLIAGDVAGGGSVPEELLRQAFDPEMIPDHRPAFEAISTDMLGRRWIRVSTRDTTVARFDLFDPGGRWLDQVDVAAAAWARSIWQPPAFARDRVAVMSDDEAGRPLVHIYRIERKE